MHRSDFRKITDINGFDMQNPLNARQNNYAWSMVEFGDYIYVGTGRNVVQLALITEGIKPFSEIEVENPDMNAEIWRYPKSGRTQQWERVYKAPDEWRIYGFRKLTLYTDEQGREALYCGAMSISNEEAFVLSSLDGQEWRRINADLPKGSNIRTMEVYNGTLYGASNNPEGYGETSYLVALHNMEEGFKPVPVPEGPDMPRGEIMSMEVFDGWLYVGTALSEGFGVWKSRNPENGQWTLVVDQGAGDALNEWAMTMVAFENHLYVGSAIGCGVKSVDSELGYIPMKGFDLIRINKEDQWEVIVGSDPILPTRPKTGERNQGRYPSGLGNLFNAYCWQMEVHDDRLYLSSWDSALILQDILGSILGDETSLEDVIRLLLEKEDALFSRDYRWVRWIKALVMSLPRYPHEHGFDLYATDDGECFCPISKTGFKNQRNYGLRTMVSADDGKLYMGTANPYEGAEVWTYKDDEC